ncbi:hypothetical protein [Verminephrobacter eiseniae]|nr:hypothetical protein [Verminephrobacter eiseniae]
MGFGSECRATGHLFVCAGCLRWPSKRSLRHLIGDATPRLWHPAVA